MLAGAAPLPDRRVDPVARSPPARSSLVDRVEAAASAPAPGEPGASRPLVLFKLARRRVAAVRQPGKALLPPPGPPGLQSGTRFSLWSGSGLNSGSARCVHVHRRHSLVSHTPIKRQTVLSGLQDRPLTSCLLPRAV